MAVPAAPAAEESVLLRLFLMVSPRMSVAMHIPAHISHTALKAAHEGESEAAAASVERMLAAI